jgi:hypothetical protein
MDAIGVRLFLDLAKEDVPWLISVGFQICRPQRLDGGHATRRAATGRCGGAAYVGRLISQGSLNGTIYGDSS